MINQRPASLLADVAYTTLPKPPIQPITSAMSKAAGGTLHDKPSAGEIMLFRERGTEFQLVSVVLNCVAAGEANGTLRVRPFAVTLIPASKRGHVDERAIDAITNIDVTKWLASHPTYSGYDPFSGEWSLYGSMPGYLDSGGKGFLDEIGIVVDQYFLATETPEGDEILTMDLQMPTEQMKERYERYRKRLLFTPFKRVEARRVWGAETAIELFLIQALAREQLYPECQILIMEDGATFPSLYHLWQDIEFRHGAALVTEVDLFFPEQKVAIFCDGAHHSRGKQKAKDEAIKEKLKAFGIRAVRIPGADIKFDLPKAIAAVKAAFS